MPIKQTIRFYTSNDQYMGWKYRNEVTYFNIIQWTNNQNYFLINDQRIDKYSSKEAIFALLRRKK